MDGPDSHCGRIVVLHDRGVTIDDLAFNLRHTNVPYAASDLRTPPAQTAAAAVVVVVVASAPQRPAAKVSARAEFKVGDRVTFNDRDNLPVTGSVSRVNRKTVSVTPDNMVGRWRVWAALTNRRVDIRHRRPAGAAPFGFRKAHPSRMGIGRRLP